jgi:hypothetical protein
LHQLKSLLPLLQSHQGNKNIPLKKVTEVRVRHSLSTIVDPNSVPDDSDSDSADKLESYRNSGLNSAWNFTSSEEDLSCDDSDNDDLEVSFVSHASRVKKSTASPVGPRGEMRRLVLGALKSLDKALWKSAVIRTVEMRRHARALRVTLLSAETMEPIQVNMHRVKHSASQGERIIWEVY